MIQNTCALPHTQPPHRMDSTREASSNRPARGATARAAGAGGPTVVGLTRGGRKQASVRARKTKQLRITSRKELKVELANVCTCTSFITWKGKRDVKLRRSGGLNVLHCTYTGVF